MTSVLAVSARSYHNAAPVPYPEIKMTTAAAPTENALLTQTALKQPLKILFLAVETQSLNCDGQVPGIIVVKSPHLFWAQQAVNRQRETAE